MAKYRVYMITSDALYSCDSCALPMPRRPPFVGPSFAVVLNSGCVAVCVVQHCGTKPFEQANTVAELFILHEQACFPASENKALVKTLKDRVGSLNSEVEALKVRPPSLSC